MKGCCDYDCWYSGTCTRKGEYNFSNCPIRNPTPPEDLGSVMPQLPPVLETEQLYPDIAEMCNMLKRLDEMFTALDSIYAAEGVCPYPQLQGEEHCACKYDMACNLGDPKPRREAHEHVKKAYERFMAWM